MSVLQVCSVHAVCTVESGTKQHSESRTTSSASLWQLFLKIHTFVTNLKGSGSLVEDNTAVLFLRG